MQSRLTALPENAVAAPRLHPDLDAVCACSMGGYPWDDWERYALARGLDADLAGLGRLLIREAFNHGWEVWLKSVCGWSDDGQALLAFALRAPKTARRQWDILLRTDGLRGDYPPAQGCRLELTDLNPERRTLTIRRGKGKKDPWALALSPGWSAT